MRMNLKVVKEVKAIDRFVALMDYLEAMGYDTSSLTGLDVATLNYDITRAIEDCEKLIPQ